MAVEHGYAASRGVENKTDALMREVGWPHFPLAPIKSSFRVGNRERQMAQCDYDVWTHVKRYRVEHKAHTTSDVDWFRPDWVEIFADGTCKSRLWDERETDWLLSMHVRKGRGRWVDWPAFADWISGRARTKHFVTVFLDLKRGGDGYKGRSRTLKIPDTAWSMSRCENPWGFTTYLHVPEREMAEAGVCHPFAWGKAKVPDYKRGKVVGKPLF